MENITLFDFTTFTKFTPTEKFSKYVKVTSGTNHHAAIDQKGCLYTWGEKYFILFIEELSFV